LRIGWLNFSDSSAPPEHLHSNEYSVVRDWVSVSKGDRTARRGAGGGDLLVDVNFIDGDLCLQGEDIDGPLL